MELEQGRGEYSNVIIGLRTEANLEPKRENLKAEMRWPRGLSLGQCRLILVKLVI